MKGCNKLLIIFVIVMLAVIVGGTYWSSQNKENIVQTEQPKGTTREIKNNSTEFIDGLLRELPEGYTVSEVEYLESFGAKPQKAMEAKPCDDKNSDPTYSPLCYTKLTILEQEKTNNLNEFIKTNKTISAQEAGTNLQKGTYRGNIPFVYTPRAFMCIGTGGDSCIRKRFVYHLEDGSNILAEISFWQFKNGQYANSLSKEVQDVIDVYENLLINIPEQTRETLSTETFDNDKFSVSYPSNFTEEEDNNGTVTISGSEGKIVIGDFEPDAGPGPAEGMTQEQLDEFPKDIVYHGYNNSIASALFYKTGDQQTREQLLKIQRSIELK